MAPKARIPHALGSALAATPGSPNGGDSSGRVEFPGAPGYTSSESMHPGSHCKTGSSGLPFHVKHHLPLRDRAAHEMTAYMYAIRRVGEGDNESAPPTRGLPPA